MVPHARYTIDCDVLPQTTAAYLRVAGDECAFIEAHTAHALPKLLDALATRGRRPEDVRWIVVTHAHLDHAAGAGALLARCPNATSSRTRAQPATSSTRRSSSRARRRSTAQRASPSCTAASIRSRASARRGVRRAGGPCRTHDDLRRPLGAPRRRRAVRTPEARRVAVMMKRTWRFDVLRCPMCARKMRVVATLTQPDVVKKILDHLGVRATPLPRAPAREPAWEQVDMALDGFDVDAA